ncbi:hypothetical protein [Neisseria bacilliformis]|nr:hypothetical protein [Neisseria bacilliformis]
MCRTANPSVSRKPQTACVAAPHTLPWRQRPSENMAEPFFRNVIPA